MFAIGHLYSTYCLSLFILMFVYRPSQLDLLFNFIYINVFYRPSLLGLLFKFIYINV